VRAAPDVELLTTGQVAGLFKVDPKTVTRWGHSGRLLTMLTLGGQFRFFAAEVEALLRGETREKARKLGLADKAKLAGGAP
jgi:predicted site-specific integrase-resolvase